MTAGRNLVHMAALAFWVLLGLLFSLKAVFGGGPFLAGILNAGLFWLWFAGLAALTTFAVSRWSSPLAAPAVHGAVVMFLLALPARAPLGVLRFGIDLLRHG